MILDDSRGLESVRIPPFYIPVTWQDTVTPLASRDISAFSKCVERTLRLPNVQREPRSFLRSGLPHAQP